METDICDRADAAPNVASDGLRVKSDLNPKSGASCESNLATAKLAHSKSTSDKASNAETYDASTNPPKDDVRSLAKEKKRQPSPMKVDDKSLNDSNGRKKAVDVNSHHSHHDSSQSGRLKRCKHGRVFVKDSSRKKLNSHDVDRSQSRQSSPPLAGNSELSSESYVKSNSSLKDRHTIDIAPSQSHSQSYHHNSTPLRSHTQPKTPQPRSLDNNHKDSDAEKTIHKAATQASLESNSKESLSARLSTSPTSSYSNSSDIYDPEGPVLLISPGDSPPLSPPIGNDIHGDTYHLNHKNDDDMPSSAVQLCNQEKYLRKLNRQERVAEEVKIALKPHYQKRAISKEQYKDVLRRAVPKICHSKDGEINPVKIRALVGAYVKSIKSGKPL